MVKKQLNGTRQKRKENGLLCYEKTV